jgi:O-antigen/teichoic acid export membrane protein
VYDQVRRLLRHSAAYTFATALNRAFAIVLLPIYTRFLTQAEYGDFALLLAAVAILWVAFDLGLSQATTRFYFEHESEEDRRRFIGSIWVTMSVAAGALAVALTLFGEPLFAAAMPGVEFWPYVVLTVWATFLNTGSIIPKVLMRVREQSTRLVLVVLGQSLFLLVAVLIFVVVLDMGLSGAVLASFIQCAAIYLVFTVYTLRNASLRVRWAYASPAVRMGAPIILLETGWWVLDTSDRLILRQYESARIVALYSVGYALGRLVIMLSASIDQAWTPFFYAEAKKDDPQARRLAAYAATYFLLAVASAGLVIAVFAHEVVVLFAGESYADAATVTPLILVASVVQGMFYVPSRGLLLKKRTALLPWVVGAGAGVNLAMNLLLIPAWGMWGAAVATIAGYSAAVAVAFALSQRVYRIDYQVRRMAITMSLFLGLVAAATLVQPGTWAGNAAWKALVLASWPLLLLASRVFEPRELTALGRLVRRRPATRETPA